MSFESFAGKAFAAARHTRPFDATPVKGGLTYTATGILLAAFAFAFNWATGHRGVFLFDQSHVFDGGWRVLQGQIPYKDFVMPYGPVVFWLQGACFGLLGVNWTATVLPACLFNSIATLSVIRITRLLSGGSRALALFAGLATAVCFQPPFGTLWFDQSALFFIVLALHAVVESLGTTPLRRTVWQILSGLCLCLAFLCRQNFGVLFAPAILAVLLAGELPDVRRASRATLMVGFGVAAGLALFLGWVLCFSNWAWFVHYFFGIASQIGRPRLTPRTIAEALALGAVPNLFQIDLIGFLSGAVALVVAAWNYRTPAWRELAPPGAAALMLPLCRSLSQTTTNNDWENNVAFLGLGFALGFHLASRMWHFLAIVPAGNAGTSIRLPPAGRLRSWLAIAAAIWALASVSYIGKTAWHREVEQFTKLTRFDDPVRARGMERLRWGEPTPIRKTATRQRADFEGVAAYLEAKGGNFFVMGDSAIFYGLLGVPSPQPLLYFESSHSFLPGDVPDLDSRIAASLRRNRIKTVVRERQTFLTRGPDEYKRFPKTWAWFSSNFERVRLCGEYEIWARRPGSAL